MDLIKILLNSIFTNLNNIIMNAKSLLFSAVTLFAAVGAYAQNDITPDRFKFANQPEGQFKIDYFNASANPANGWQTPIETSDAGYLVLAGAPAKLGTSGEANESNMAQSIQAMTTIVDLGGEVGKVLCVKGPNSNYENGAEKIDGADIGWYNLNFYTPYSKTPVSLDPENEKPIRMRLVFSIAHNTQTSTDEMFKMYASTLANNASESAGLFNAGDFQKLDADGNPEYDENWNVAYDPTKWMVYEFDCTVGSEDGNPTRLKMEISNNVWIEGALLIKELKFMTEPVGEPIQREYLTFTPGSTTNIMELVNGKSFTVEENNVNFEAAGEIYGLNGVKVASAAAGETVELPSGFYLIKSNGICSKIVVR